MTQAGTSAMVVPAQAAVFHVGRYVCALHISRIQEINKNLLLTPVHEAPDYVRGIINLRGNIVTVIDLRRKLGLEPITKLWRSLMLPLTLHSHRLPRLDSD